MSNQQADTAMEPPVPAREQVISGRARSLQEAALAVVEELGQSTLATYFESRLTEVVEGTDRATLLDSYVRLVGPNARQLLLRICKDSTESVQTRLIAVRSLVRLKDRDAAAALRDLVLDSDPRIGTAAIRGLGELATEDAVTALMLLLGIAPGESRVEVATALARIGDRRAVDALREFIAGVGPEEQWAGRIRQFIATSEQPIQFENVPALTIAMVDRESELRQVLSTLEKRRPPIVLLEGVGGSGKTTLATEVSRRIEAAYKLWVTARSGSVVEKLKELLADNQRLVGLADVPDAEVSARVIAEIADDTRRYLVVLDGVDDVVDSDRRRAEWTFLRDLVARAPNTMILVTARTAPFAFTGQGILSVRLGPLPERAARLLLRTMVPLLDDRQSDRLARELGFYPLALTLAGRALQDAGADSSGELERLLGGLHAKPLWDHLIRRLTDGGDPSSWLALEVLALAGGDLRLGHGIAQMLASEGIDSPTLVFKRLERSGLVRSGDNQVGLQSSLLGAALRARMTSTDAGRLSQKLAFAMLQDAVETSDSQGVAGSLEQLLSMDLEPSRGLARDIVGSFESYRIRFGRDIELRNVALRTFKRASERVGRPGVLARECIKAVTEYFR